MASLTWWLGLSHRLHCCKIVISFIKFFASVSVESFSLICTSCKVRPPLSAASAVDCSSLVAGFAALLDDAALGGMDSPVAGFAALLDDAALGGMDYNDSEEPVLLLEPKACITNLEEREATKSNKNRDDNNVKNNTSWHMLSYAF